MMELINRGGSKMVNFDMYEKTTEPMFKMSEMELKLFLIYLLTGFADLVTNEQWEDVFEEANKRI
jgi:hypothetical protein